MSFPTFVGEDRRDLPRLPRMREDKAMGKSVVYGHRKVKMQNAKVKMQNEISDGCHYSMDAHVVLPAERLREWSLQTAGIVRRIAIGVVARLWKGPGKRLFDRIHDQKYAGHHAACQIAGNRAEREGADQSAE